MSTPIVRIPGTALTPVSVSSFGTNTYGSSAMRIQASGLTPANALIADFRITSITWGGTPTAGSSIQLVAVDRDFSGTQGPTPGANYIPRLCGTFNPLELASGSPGLMGVNAVALSPDADYYLYNNATGTTFVGTLSCTPWTPGT